MTTKNQEQLEIVYRYFTWNIRKRESVDLQQNNVKSRKSQFTINLLSSAEMISNTTHFFAHTQSSQLYFLLHLYIWIYGFPIVFKVGNSSLLWQHHRGVQHQHQQLGRCLCLQTAQVFGQQSDLSGSCNVDSIAMIHNNIV